MSGTELMDVSRHFVDPYMVVWSTALAFVSSSVPLDET